MCTISFALTASLTGPRVSLPVATHCVRPRLTGSDPVTKAKRGKGAEKTRVPVEVVSLVECIVGEGAGAWRDKDWMVKGATETHKEPGTVCEEGRWWWRGGILATTVATVS